MRETKYIVKSTTQFKKDYKMAIKRGMDTVSAISCRTGY